MTAMLRAALLVALVAAPIPVVATGQDTSPANLLRRIESLERANADLERRVSELEGVIKSGPSKGQPIASSTRWQDLANWRQLRQGMKPDKVRELLGEPHSVEGGDFTTWRWGWAQVRFYHGKVDSWREPPPGR
jgi:hypothetical protein